MEGGGVLKHVICEEGNLFLLTTLLPLCSQLKEDSLTFIYLPKLLIFHLAGWFQNPM